MSANAIPVVIVGQDGIPVVPINTPGGEGGDIVTGFTAVVNGENIDLKIITDLNPSGLPLTLLNVLKDTKPTQITYNQTTQEISVLLSDSTTLTTTLTGLATTQDVQELDERIGAIEVTTINKYFSNTNLSVNFPVPTVLTAIPNINLTVPETGIYRSVFRVNVQKPTGGAGVTSFIDVEGRIDGVVWLNTRKTITIQNDGTIRTIEFSFSGNLTQGQVLTAWIQSSISTCVLVTETGRLSAQLELERIK